MVNKLTNQNISFIIDLNNLVVQLHIKAIENLGKIDYKIMNSAINDNKEPFKFNGSGKHIITIMPINNKKIIDKNKCFELLTTYTKIFNGVDFSKNISIDQLCPLTIQNSTIAKDSDDNEIKESKCNNLQCLMTLFEAKSKAEIQENVIGYYIPYEISIGKEKYSLNSSSPFYNWLDNAKKSLGGISLTSVGLWGSGGTHKLGNLIDYFSYKKIDASKFLQSLRQTFLDNYPDLHPEIEILNSNSIILYLKEKLKKDEQFRILESKYSLCIKITKRDKSYKLIDKDEISELVTSSISKKGIGNIPFLNPNDITIDDIFLINNYEDNLKYKSDSSFKKEELDESNQNNCSIQILKILNEDLILNESLTDKELNRIKKIVNQISCNIKTLRDDITDELNPKQFKKLISVKTGSEVFIDVTTDPFDYATLQNDLSIFADGLDKPYSKLMDIYSTVDNYLEKENEYNFSPIEISGLIIPNEKIEYISSVYQKIEPQLKSETSNKDNIFILRQYKSLSNNNFKVKDEDRERVKLLYDKLKAIYKDTTLYFNFSLNKLIEIIKKSLNDRTITKNDLANILGIQFAKINKYIDFNNFTLSFNDFIDSKYPNFKDKKEFLRMIVDKIQKIKLQSKKINSINSDWDCYIIPMKNLEFQKQEIDTKLNKYGDHNS